MWLINHRSPISPTSHLGPCCSVHQKQLLPDSGSLSILNSEFVTYLVPPLSTPALYALFPSETSHVSLGFPGGASGKEPTCQCRRHERCGFEPWIRKIPWRRAWQSTPVFLPGESHGQRSLVGYTQSRVPKSQTQLKQFSTHAQCISYWSHKAL